MNRGLLKGTGRPVAPGPAGPFGGKAIREDGFVADIAPGALPLGYYVQAIQDGNGNLGLTKNEEVCFPLLLPGSGYLDRIALKIAALSTDAGAVLRFGVRVDDNGRPGRQVILETVVSADNTTGTTGWKSLVCSIPYGGRIIWVSYVGQGWTSSGVSLQTAWPQTTNSIAASIGGYRLALDWAGGHGPYAATQTGITGLLAATSTVPAGSTTNKSIPLCAVRRGI